MVIIKDNNQLSNKASLDKKAVLNSIILEKKLDINTKLFGITTKALATEDSPNFISVGFNKIKPKWNSELKKFENLIEDVEFLGSLTSTGSIQIQDKTYQVRTTELLLSKIKPYNFNGQMFEFMIESRLNVTTDYESLNSVSLSYEVFIDYNVGNYLNCLFKRRKNNEIILKDL